MFAATFRVTCHTDYVGPGSTFVAIPGTRYDGVMFIPQALARGAQTVVMQHGSRVPSHVAEAVRAYDAEVRYVADARRALSKLSAAAYGDPSSRLCVIGVTGTKGKTSTTFMLAHILQMAGYRTALTGTIQARIGDDVYPCPLTTPQPDYMHAFFHACLQAGVTHVVMEVAAQGLSLHRVDDIVFRAGIFTNFGREHGEFYASQDEYFAAKCCLANRVFGGTFWVNGDDERVAALADRLPHARYFTSCPQAAAACPATPGAFNAYNWGAAEACARGLGVSEGVCRQAPQTFAGVPGRMEEHQLENGARVIIDYAHSPTAFEAVLSCLSKMTSHLIIVFGCGGDRDREKRPLMGARAAAYGDLVIITSDNPRSESVEAITHDIYQGVPEHQRHKVIVCSDRAEAVARACDQTRPDSIVALLGRGPDIYQSVGRITYPLSERTLLTRYKQRLAENSASA